MFAHKYERQAIVDQKTDEYGDAILFFSFNKTTFAFFKKDWLYFDPITL